MQATPMTPGRPGALALVSGGLDSAVALGLLLEQGVPVTALHFVSIFSPGKDPGGRLAAREVTRPLGVRLVVRDATGELMKIVPAPRHGWGRHVNPCVDCRIMELRAARDLMPELGASFVATGEVLGQRPMSQHRAALELVAREAGLEGLVLRPLSAKRLEPTRAELEGWVDRSRLLDVRGRSRAVQGELARRWGLTGFTTPAGGCRLTDEAFARRLEDVLNWEGGLAPSDVHLMKLGRHFRLDGYPPARVVLGRNERENAKLLAFRRPCDVLLVASAGRSPEAILRGDTSSAAVGTAAALVARFSAHREAPQVEVEAREVGPAPGLLPSSEATKLAVRPSTDDDVRRLSVGSRARVA